MKYKLLKCCLQTITSKVVIYHCTCDLENNNGDGRKHIYRLPSEANCFKHTFLLLSHIKQWSLQVEDTKCVRTVELRHAEAHFVRGTCSRFGKMTIFTNIVIDSKSKVCIIFQQEKLNCLIFLNISFSMDIKNHKSKSEK